MVERGGSRGGSAEPDRRQFLRRATLGGVAAAGAPLAGLAQTPRAETPSGKGAPPPIPRDGETGTPAPATATQTTSNSD